MSANPDAACVSVNVPCRVCGYNLKTHLTHELCSECGTPILRSLSSDLLHLASPTYVAEFRQYVGAAALVVVLWAVLAVVAPTVMVVSATANPVDWSRITATLYIDRSLTAVLAGVFTWTTVAMVGLNDEQRSWSDFRSVLVCIAVGSLLVLAAVDLYLLRGISAHQSCLPVFGAFGIDCIRTILTVFVLPLVFLSSLLRFEFTRTSRLIGRCTGLAAAWGLITGIVFILESVMLIFSEYAEASSGAPSWSPLDLVLYVHPLALVIGLPYLGLAVASLVLTTRFAGKAYAMSKDVWYGARGRE